MATIIAKFADGRLLVQEQRNVGLRYQVSGVPVRIGLVKNIEQVVSIDNSLSRYGLMTPLNEVKIGAIISGVGRTTGFTSGFEGPDTICVVMRNGNLGSQVLGTLSGFVGLMSNTPAAISGIFANSYLYGELSSGNMTISGNVQITAWVIGY